MTSTTSKKGLAAAILAFQANPPEVVKSAPNKAYNSKYANIADWLGAVLPKLNEQGIILIQSPGCDDEGRDTLTTKLIHEPTGEAEQSTMLLKPTKPDPQGQGSAITYARRYMLEAMLGLAAEDDDGNAASSGSKTTATNYQPPRQQRNGVITERQIALIGARSREAGVPDDYLKLILKEEADVDSRKDVPRAKLDAILKRIEEYTKVTA